MATALTAGKIYLIESKTGVDDWITDHSGNPDLIDLDNYTGDGAGNNSVEGLGYCKFNFPMKFVKRGKTGMIPSTSGGGVSTSNRTGNKFYNAIIMGTTETRAAGYLIDRFLFEDRHFVPSPTTFEKYYLIIYYGTNDHEPFTNIGNSRLSYAPGIVTDFEIAWQEEKHINLNVRLNWWSQFIS